VERFCNLRSSVEEQRSEMERSIEQRSYTRSLVAERRDAQRKA
jgi:hypothetical protein